jgi:hypothetical protein
MQTTVTFELPAEAEELKMALNGHKYLTVLRATAESLRTKLKHETISPETHEHISDISRWLHAELFNNSIELYD